MSKKQDPQKIVLMALRRVYEDMPEVTRDGVYMQDRPLPDRPQFIVNVQNGNVVGNFYLKYSEMSVAGYKDYCVRALFSKTGEWEKLFYSESVRPLSDTRSEPVRDDMCIEGDYKTGYFIYYDSAGTENRYYNPAQMMKENPLRHITKQGEKATYLFFGMLIGVLMLCARCDEKANEPQRIEKEQPIPAKVAHGNAGSEHRQGMTAAVKVARTPCVLSLYDGQVRTRS